MPDSSSDAKSDAARARAALGTLNRHLTEQVIGQESTAERLLIALLANGHVILEGAPGLAKTRIARLLAEALEGQYKRIQFTPDLLPSDLVGAAIYRAEEARFEFRRGPLFSNFILADEINRAPAKVQSALLEAMEERQITSGETTYRLDDPFFVIATQNPIEHEGTWDLPKAQLDRFLMQITLNFPDVASEEQILDLAIAESERDLDRDRAREAPVRISRVDLHAAKLSVAMVHLSAAVRSYIVRLIAGTRGDPDPIEGVNEHIANPASPRGTIMLARTAQARAWLDGRDHVLPQDVQALAPDVLHHRIGLTYRAEADGVRVPDLIAALIDRVDVV